MNRSFLRKLGVKKSNQGTWTGRKSYKDQDNFLVSSSPVDGAVIGQVDSTTRRSYDRVIKKAMDAQISWRQIPAPQRGEIVRQYGEALRANKDALEDWFPMKWAKAFKKVGARSRK